MKQVYSARDPMDAHFVQGLLEHEGIGAIIEGETLPEPTGIGQFTLWVRDKDVAQAEPIIMEYNQREATRPAIPEGARSTWTCPTCGETVEEQFTNCWNCGAARPGKEGADAEQTAE